MSPTDKGKVAMEDKKETIITQDLDTFNHNGSTLESSFAVPEAKKAREELSLKVVSDLEVIKDLQQDNMVALAMIPDPSRYGQSAPMTATHEFFQKSPKDFILGSSHNLITKLWHR